MLLPQNDDKSFKRKRTFAVADTGGGGGSVVSGPPPSDLMMNKINTLIH